MAIEEIKFGFEQLKLWKNVREFKNGVAKEARKWPAEEKFKLIDQIIRSSRSINRFLLKVMADLHLPINSIFVSRQEALCQKL